MLTQEKLREILTYNPWTGAFYWLSSDWRFNYRNFGDPVGYLDEYKKVRIGGKIYKLHRLAFLYMTGEMPDFVDHIDGDKHNNAWRNLRECSQQQNCMNRGHQKNNTSGFKGVSFDKAAGKFSAKISVGGKKRHLGMFKTAETAHQRYCEASRHLHGEFGRTS